MTLYDRKNEFNNNNLSLCESKCTYKGYNSSSSKAICDCYIKSNMTYSRNNSNQKELLNKLENDKSNSNLDVTQCLNVFSSPEELKSNSGFFLLLFILATFIIIFIIFCIKGRNMAENKIDEIIYKNFEEEKNKINKEHKKRIKKKRKSSKNKKIKKNNELNKKIKTIINLNDGTKEKLANNKNNIKRKGPIIELNHKNNIIKGKKESVIVPDPDNDYELNTLEYIYALKYDKRTYCEYYLSLIKNKQLFAFTFCSFNDYNSGIIKKFTLFLSFALHYTINALFFNDSNMHQIYEDKGKYNFTYQLPKILISAVSSTVILRIMLETLILIDKNILQVKHQKTYNLAVDMKNKILKCINIKYAIFFILNFILLVLFWFYLTCLNDVYTNTQTYIIENTCISFCFSLFYPFIINIIPACLRNIALDKKSKNKNYIYSSSQIFQIL